MFAGEDSLRSLFETDGKRAQIDFFPQRGQSRQHRFRHFVVTSCSGVNKVLFQEDGFTYPRDVALSLYNDARDNYIARNWIETKLD